MFLEDPVLHDHQVICGDHSGLSVVLSNHLPSPVREQLPDSWVASEWCTPISVKDPEAGSLRYGEPVEVRSGYSGNEMGAYVEFRDQKVAFFVRRLARGKHSVSYRLRAEITGKFSALPTRAYAMYAPELKANSDEIKLIINDN